jgi:hypothetical protein
MTTATILETSPRAADWQKVFGRLRDIPLKSPFPLAINVPGKPGVMAYFLDLATLTDDERARLIDHIAERFAIQRDQVAIDIGAAGVPVLAEDVLISIPQDLALSMSEWDYEEDDDDECPCGCEGDDSKCVYVPSWGKRQ